MNYVTFNILSDLIFSIAGSIIWLQVTSNLSNKYYYYTYLSKWPLDIVRSNNNLNSVFSPKKMLSEKASFTLQVKEER